MLGFLEKGLKSKLGIDISPEGITITCLTSESNFTKADKFLFKPFEKEILQNGLIEKPEILTNTLKEILNETKIECRTAVVSIPSHNMFIKRITLPDIPKEEIKAIAPQEAAKHVPLTINELNVDFEILESTKKQDESGKKVDVVLCALSKSIAKSYIEPITNAGIRIEALDVSPFAKIKALAHSKLINNPEEIYISVLMGYENTDINVIQNGMPLFSHNIQIGKKSVIDAVINSFQLNKNEADSMLEQVSLIIPGQDMSTDPELNKAANAVKGVYSSISNETQKAIEFFNSQNTEAKAISQIFIGGCGACIGNIDRYFSNKLKVESYIFNPFDNITIEAETADNTASVSQLTSYSTSVGLALKGLEN